MPRIIGEKFAPRAYEGYLAPGQYYAYGTSIPRPDIPIQRDVMQPLGSVTNLPGSVATNIPGMAGTDVLQAPRPTVSPTMYSGYSAGVGGGIPPRPAPPRMGSMSWAEVPDVEKTRIMQQYRIRESSPRQVQGFISSWDAAVQQREREKAMSAERATAFEQEKELAGIKAEPGLARAVATVEAAQIRAKNALDVATQQAEAQVARDKALGVNVNDPSYQARRDREKADALAIESRKAELAGDRDTALELLKASIAAGKVTTEIREAFPPLGGPPVKLTTTETTAFTPPAGTPPVAPATSTIENLTPKIEKPGEIPTKDEMAWQWANKEENKNTLKGKQMLKMLKDRYGI